ncbi:MAG: amidase [Alphaproteobacteria bacterium]
MSSFSVLPLNALSAVEIAERVRSGTVSEDDIVESALRRIAERDEQIRAWACFRKPGSSALYSTACRNSEGPLAGVPVGIKDIFDTADFPTRYGSRIFSLRQPDSDALVVARLRSAGATILGKTHTTEFACFEPAATVNPIDVNRTPGGSSSGSAAAVADKMVPIAIGSQTAGSTIRPAAFCGVYGFKPSYGLVPLDGTMPLAQSLDTIGIFARSVDDIALATSVLSGEKTLGTALPKKPAGIAFLKGPAWPQVSDETKGLFQSLMDRLGSEVPTRELAQPRGFEQLTDAQKIVMAREAYKNFASVIVEKPSLISESFLKLCEHGSQISESAYRKALLLKNEAYLHFIECLGDGELVLTPAALGVANPASEGTGDPICNRLWTFLGTPCISIPVHRPKSLPLAFQVVSPKGADDQLLRSAQWLAEATSTLSIASPIEFSPQF